ncbi:hypothetical protein BH10CYA1_BH10CYA1_00280 [soil metagenome]
MFHLSVRPERLLGTAIQFISLSVCVGAWPLAAHADLQGGTKTDSPAGGASQAALTGGANQTVLTGGTKATSLSATAAQTLLNGAAKIDALPAGVNQNLLNGNAKSGLIPAGASQNPLDGSVQSGTLSGGTKQTQLNGNAATNSLTTGASHTPLQGGIKDDASLNPSLRLLKPATAKGGRPLAPGIGATFIPGQVTQISGHTTSGPLAPFLQPSTAQPGVFQRTLSGTIAPISTYTMTRSNSRTWVAPGYEVTPANISRSSAFVPPTSSSSASITQHGVTTWVPGFDVSSISQVAGATASTIVGHGTGAGIAAYLPQYEVHKISVTSPPMAYDPAATTQKGVTAFAPGYEVTVISHSKGAVSWTPGYELSKLVPFAYKETLSGVWHSGSPTPALLASQGVLPQPQFTKVLVGPAPMVATGLLLPQLRAQVLEKLTWDEWYRRVARAIYCRWQYAEVGPGCATIRMVVTKDRDIGCQLIDFVPAPDIKRDVAAETLFRESAVKAVNMVTKFEIPDLPTPLDSDKVVFDLDLKRLVDGPVGVDVANRK